MTDTSEHMDDETLTRLIMGGGLAHFIGLHADNTEQK